jgi:hypothetical protein
MDMETASARSSRIKMSIKREQMCFKKFDDEENGKNKKREK